MQDKTEWKLNGQVLVFTLPLSDQVCSLLTQPLPLALFLWSVFMLRAVVDLHDRSCKTLDVSHTVASCQAGLCGRGLDVGHHRRKGSEQGFCFFLGVCYKG